MKKLSFIFLALLMPLMASAYDANIDGIYYNLNYETKQAEVTSGDVKYAYEGSIIIPDTINYNGVTYSVTSIGNSAFAACYAMTSVTIGNSVTSIGSNAFQYCYGLTSIEIPNSVTTIGFSAFLYSYNLKSITIGNGVTEIEDRVFYNCTGLTSVHITDIAAWCKIKFKTNESNPLDNAKHLFMNGREIEKLVIPDSVTSIGDYAFRGCSALTSVTIPNSVTSIGNYAFSGCSGITSITIPNNVTSIGKAAFNNCTGLTEFTIPSNVTTIGDGTFGHCTGLTSITIPNSVTTIGYAAFSDCSSLTSIAIPNNVEAIDNYAFYNCSGLKDFYCYAENVPSTNLGAFNNLDLESGITLYVPKGSMAAYKATEPWSGFGTIKAIEDITPEVPKCATPIFAIFNGKLILRCATEGVKYECNVGFETDNDLTIPSKVKISLYATKDGYEPSDTITQEIPPRLLLGQIGDIDGDGKVGMTDVMYLVQKILKGKFPDE